MSIRVIFLGTGGSVPTQKRGLPAILVQRKNEQLMFDCGEGAQRQMIRTGGGFHRKMKIFITHMHGDHILGLPGLLQTMALLDRQRKLEIFGPPGTVQFLQCIKETLKFVLTFQVELHEIKEPGVICEEEEYLIEAVWTNHAVPNLSYALLEKPRSGRFYPEKARKLGVPEGPLWSKLQQGHKVKLPDGQTVRPEQVVGPSRGGRKIVYSGDTTSSESLAKLAAKADLLIHDATLDDDLADRACEDGHSTPSQAAEIAKKAKVKQLILTHISARYDDTSKLLDQAKKKFRNTHVAEDFMKIEIPLSDN
ncbi:ribonuclease Z [Candidatus Bathyarchaeota archaeon]|nr:ribonuclease Z [Candidatus Bathyarchaeota archaeon]